MEREIIADRVSTLCERFDDAYWLQRDRDGRYPHELREALARDGWLGITVPEAYGGSGLGVTEATAMMQAISESGAGFGGASSIAGFVLFPKVICAYGTDAQKQRWLPGLMSGEDLSAFGITEPNAGLDTSQLQTRADRVDGGYVVNGSKVWNSNAQVARKLLFLARTSPKDEARPFDGISLFYTDFRRDRIEVREIEKMGRKCVDSNQIFIDAMEVPEEDRIGEEGKGFRYLLDTLNPERIVLGAQAVGLGRCALKKAVRYAGDRVVFGRPIGQNQGIQHPLAECWMELHAAELVAYDAARRFDAGLPCGTQANAAKYLGGEAGFKACTTAVMTHGGMGYSKEFHVERYLRESLIPRIAPISRELILCYVAEKELGLPRSY